MAITAKKIEFARYLTHQLLTFLKIENEIHLQMLKVVITKMTYSSERIQAR